MAGGATVGLGVGCGAVVVGAVVGLAECVVVPWLAEPVVWPADGAVVAPADLCVLADADADGEGDRDEPLADGEALGLPDGWVCAVGGVPAEL